MKNGTVIAFDLDDVVFPFVPEMNDFYNRANGTNFKPEDYDSYSFHRVWGISKRLAAKRVDDFIDSDYFRRMEPTQEAVEILLELAGRGRVLPFITSRHERLKEITLRSLRRNRLKVPEVISGVYLSRNHYTGHGSGNGSKADICRMLGARFLVDDSPHYALQFAEVGGYAFLVDQRWNRHFKAGGRIIRIPSVGKILEYAN